MMTVNDSCRNATDEELISEVRQMIHDENHLLAGLLSRIAEIDERRLYARLGFRSMFAFLTDELHLSEDAAYKRIAAARTARRFPLILDMVAKGDIHLSTIAILGSILTEENHREILEKAIHRSKSRSQNELEPHRTDCNYVNCMSVLREIEASMSF